MGQSDGTTKSTETEAQEQEPNPAAAPTSAPPAVPGASTLLTGAAFQSTWRMQGLSSAPPAEPDGSGVHALGSAAASAADSGETTVDGVGETSAPAPATEASLTPSAAAESGPTTSSPAPRPNLTLQNLALADTQRANQAAGKPRRGGNPNLARTLRMDIGLVLKKTSDAADAVPPSAAGAAAQQPAAPRKLSDAPVVAGATQRIGAQGEPESSSARPSARATDPLGMPPATNTLRGASDPATPSARAASGGPQATRSESARPPRLPSVPSSESTQTTTRVEARRRAQRVGAQTVITRRHRVPTRDWLFVGLLVAALGVTASLLLSYRSSTHEETVDADVTTVEHTVNTALEGSKPAKAAAPAAVQALAQNMTEIASVPAGAEVVSAGAVIGNTPVRVTHTDFDADYLVRLGGHEPQLIRVRESSPATIMVTLKPLAR